MPQDSTVRIIKTDAWLTGMAIFVTIAAKYQDFVTSHYFPDKGLDSIENDSKVEFLVNIMILLSVPGLVAKLITAIIDRACASLCNIWLVHETGFSPVALCSSISSGLTLMALIYELMVLGCVFAIVVQLDPEQLFEALIGLVPSI